MLEFSEPAAAVIKHTNPCGVATGAGAAEAYVRARDADALAAFGGIVGLNRRSMSRPRAPSSRRSSKRSSRRRRRRRARILATKPNLRVVTTDFSQIPEADRDIRSLVGALVEQSRDRVTEAIDELA